MPPEKEYIVLGQMERGEGAIGDVFKRDWLKYRRGAMIVPQASAASLSKQVEREAMMMQLDKAMEMKQLDPTMPFNFHQMMDDFFKRWTTKTGRRGSETPTPSSSLRKSTPCYNSRAAGANAGSGHTGGPGPSPAGRRRRQPGGAARGRAEEQVAALEDDLRKADIGNRIQKMQGLSNQIKAELAKNVDWRDSADAIREDMKRPLWLMLEEYLKNKLHVADSRCKDPGITDAARLAAAYSWQDFNEILHLPERVLKKTGG